MSELDAMQAAAAPVGSQDGSQPGSQPDATPTAAAAPADAKTPEQYQAELDALQGQLSRANKQISAVQKKYMNTIKGRVTSPATPADPNADGQGNETEVVFAAMKMAGNEIRDALEENIIPLYDGSDENADEPALSAKEIAQIRRNPLAFVSQDTLRYTLQTGDLQPALIEIEQAMADKAEASAAQPAPAKIPKAINNNPAPAGAAPKDSQFDPWSASMQDLEQEAKAAASRVAQQ